MRRDEVAVITCSIASMCEEPRLHLKGQAGLLFKLVVVDYEKGPNDMWDNPVGYKSRDELNIQFAEARREVGAALFKAGRFNLAAERYKKAYELLGYVDDFRGIKG